MATGSSQGGRVLHVLAQRPGLTGSGITLDALVREAALSGWDQQVLVGVPGEGLHPEVGPLAADRIHTVRFGGPGADLPFPVVGMSDVMPYPSTRWSDLDAAALAAYRSVWRRRIAGVCARFRPDVIDVHHAWVVAGEVGRAAPDIPRIVHTHGTALRQLELCPSLVDEVVSGCRDADAFAVLHDEHARTHAERYGIPRERIHVVGAGFRTSIFRPPADAAERGRTIAYAGKLCAAKGLPWLLDAIERLAARHPDLRLHVAGGGAGDESAALKERMQALDPLVAYHGLLDPPGLAKLFGRCRVFALPSLHEGLPLVLIEALACGCLPVATDLPGIGEAFASRVGPDRLRLVAPPGLDGPDRPRPGDLPAFVSRLATALEDALLDSSAPPPGAESLEPFTWRATFRRVSRIWTDLA